MAYKGRIPFDPKTGEMVQRAYGSPNDYVWKDNHTFVMAMRLVDCYATRGSACFELEDASQPPGGGNKFYMFLKHFFEMASTSKLQGGLTEPIKWTFVKRGDKYAIAKAP